MFSSRSPMGPGLILSLYSEMIFVYGVREKLISFFNMAVQFSQYHLLKENVLFPLYIFGFFAINYLTLSMWLRGGYYTHVVMLGKNI